MINITYINEKKDNVKTEIKHINYRLDNMNGHSVEKSLPKGVPFDDYQPPNWDEFFMLKVYLTGNVRIMLNQQTVFSFI